MKMIVAVLVGKSGDTVRLSVDGAETDIERKEIAQIRLHVDF